MLIRCLRSNLFRTVLASDDAMPDGIVLRRGDDHGCYNAVIQGDVLARFTHGKEAMMLQELSHRAPVYDSLLTALTYNFKQANPGGNRDV